MSTRELTPYTFLGTKKSGRELVTASQEFSVELRSDQRVPKNSSTLNLVGNLFDGRGAGQIAPHASIAWSAAKCAAALPPSESHRNSLEPLTSSAPDVTL